jgi:hypothetical protein
MQWSLHVTMLERVTTLPGFDATATCVRYGYAYLVCDERNPSAHEKGQPATRRNIYRLSSADDGSDSQVMSRWSWEW